MATLTAVFLADGSVKVEVSGEIDVTIHDAVQADLDALVLALGGNATHEALGPEEAHVHGGHVHVHHGPRR